MLKFSVSWCDVAAEASQFDNCNISAAISGSSRFRCSRQASVRTPMASQQGTFGSQLGLLFAGIKMPRVPEGKYLLAQLTQQMIVLLSGTF